jgi:hypothetical protein
MPDVDVTITACKRPAVLRKTLESFFSKMWNSSDLNTDKFRAVINVDPVGESGSAAETVDVCRDYFIHIIARTPDRPSFPGAFIWCWSQVVAPYVFHLEDDWELLLSVDFCAMKYVMEKDQELALLRLPYRKADSNNTKQWNVFYPWNGEYYECPREHVCGSGFAGHPSLIRSEFVKQALRYLNPGLNPEKQFHYSRVLRHLCLQWKFGVFSAPGWGPVIRDIGREWIAGTKWAKAGNRGFFTKWEER